MGKEAKEEITQIWREGAVAWRAVNPQNDERPELPEEDQGQSSIKSYATRERLYLHLPKHGVGAELGVWYGENAISLLKASKPHKMYCVDPYDQRKVEEGKLAESNAKELLSNYSAVEFVKMYDWDWLPNIDDNHLDWSYVDTLHSYAATIKELRLLGDKVKHVIAGHDFVIHSLFTPPTGVIRAVLQFVGERDDWSLAALTEDCPFPSFALVRHGYEI